MPLKIVVVEDDHLDREWIEGELKEHFRGAAIELIETERKFCEQLEHLAQHSPNIIILDIMLKWDTPREDQRVVDVPKQVREEGCLYCRSSVCLLSSTGRYPEKYSLHPI